MAEQSYAAGDGWAGRGALIAFYPDRASAQASVQRLIRRCLGRGYQVIAWWCGAAGTRPGRSPPSPVSTSY